MASSIGRGGKAPEHQPSRLEKISKEAELLGNSIKVELHFLAVSFHEFSEKISNLLSGRGYDLDKDVRSKSFADLNKEIKARLEGRKSTIQVKGFGAGSQIAIDIQKAVEKFKKNEKNLDEIRKNSDRFSIFSEKLQNKIWDEVSNVTKEFDELRGTLQEISPRLVTKFDTKLQSLVDSLRKQATTSFKIEPKWRTQISEEVSRREKAERKKEKAEAAKEKEAAAKAKPAAAPKEDKRLKELKGNVQHLLGLYIKQADKPVFSKTQRKILNEFAAMDLEKMSYKHIKQNVHGAIRLVHKLYGNVPKIGTFEPEDRNLLDGLKKLGNYEKALATISEPKKTAARVREKQKIEVFNSLKELINDAYRPIGDKNLKEALSAQPGTFTKLQIILDMTWEDFSKQDTQKISQDISYVADKIKKGFASIATKDELARHRERPISVSDNLATLAKALTKLEAYERLSQTKRLNKAKERFEQTVRERGKKPSKTTREEPISLREKERRPEKARSQEAPITKAEKGIAWYNFAQSSISAEKPIREKLNELNRLAKTHAGIKIKPLVSPFLKQINNPHTFAKGVENYVKEVLRKTDNEHHLQYAAKEIDRLLADYKKTHKM